MDQSRKLAAVLVADVVGFSRLTGPDEDRNLARLALLSDLIDPSKCRLLWGHREWLTCGQSDANGPLSDPSLFSIYRGENDAKFLAFHF